MLKSLSGVILLALLHANALMGQYVGSQACRVCHPANFENQSRTGHAHALSLALAGSPGHWAFGAGAKAITYVSQFDKYSYVEHGLSYYPATRTMALTPGHSTPADAQYRTFDPEATVLRCFRCHSTGPLRLEAGYDVQPFEPGVHCESCHGPGAAHVKSGGPKAIRNPKHLTAAELNVFCGSCHRQPAEGDWTDPWKTRHQPSSLVQAACFRKSAGSLSCLTCHDSHSPLDRASADYDKKCVGCHAAARHRAPVAARSCVDCHMPQVATNAPVKFTNHWIGVYGKGNNLVPATSIAKSLPPAPAVTRPLDAPADPAGLRPLYEQALTDSQKASGPNDVKVARSAADLGQFLSKNGDPAGAEAALRRAVAIDTSSSDSNLAADQENLAQVLVVNRKAEEAFRLFQQAAAGPDPQVAARCFASLAMLDPAHAESYYRNALQAEERASGKSYRRVAILLNNLALALEEKKDYAAAEPLLRRALDLLEKESEPDSLVAASTLSNLGSLLQTKGQVAEAERLERSAIRIFEQRLGPYSAELATGYTNLADLLDSRGDRASAANFYRRAISIDETVYGADDPEVAGDLVNLGDLLEQSGQRPEADAVMRRALAIYEKSFGANSQQAMQVKRALSRGR